ncbi:MAG TPA: nitrate- and nitrite sensing domain-containing protein [Streptosporangiaceae bacterium]|jgi:signal transduction histidine kinase|nr:nitrate- and nitrite sensing domain-containing protein [Streptosporangiaceae bacterium]
MFAVPLMSLLALWGFVASTTVGAAVQDHDFNTTTRATNGGIALLVAALPQERQETFVWLLNGRQSGDASMLAARKLVDKAIPMAEAALESERGLLSAGSRPVASALRADLGRIAAVRKAVDAGSMTAPAAFQAYDTVVDAEFHFFTTSVQDRSTSLAGVSVGAVDGSYALEMATREVALIDGALADHGQLSPAVRDLFVSSAAQRRQLLSETVALVPVSLDANYVNDSPSYRQFEAMEGQILASTGGKVPVNANTWRSATGTYLNSTEKAQVQNGTALAAMSASQSDRLVTEAGLAGGVGLLAVVASVFLLTWFGRKVSRDLGSLNMSVRSMAEERLPRVVERLRKGEDVDVSAESPSPGTSSIQEISHIAESFATVQAAAVAAAVDQARLRKGVNQVFLNISMRNQSLLHRQLGMLDDMERRTGDPKALAELFRLDHLTTRMRRHAEGLIILSGSTPGRGWRGPVPVVDVLRAAVAEVEDYVRVDVVSESRDLVAGSAVNDIIHLAAELVENATVFSPPNTRIEVRADRVGTGLVAEIEDRGLGLTEEERGDINRRLASPPEFDLTHSDQLGLFIVSQLATRHDIRVSLRESAYGGTTAIVWLPFGVIVREEDEDSGLGGAWETADGAPVRPDDPRFDANEPPFPPDGAAPRLGPAGRHRLPAAATGRLADGGVTAAAEPTPVPAPRTAPRAPWELPYSGRQEQGPVPAVGPTAGTAPPWKAGPPTSPWPQAPEREGMPVRSSPSPSEPERPGPVSPGSHLGMPVRVPQASLSPQLRGRRQADARAAAREEPDVAPRSPEVTRDMLLSMQEGWLRGRVDDLDDPHGAPDDGTYC